MILFRVRYLFDSPLGGFYINIRKISVVGVLIAIEIILSRFLAITTPIVKISFAFIPIVLIAIMYGKVYAGVASALGDFIGAILFPIGGYFPGFTLSAFLSGYLYGVFFYEKELTLKRTVTCVTIISLVVHLGLNSLWLYFMMNKAFLAILLPRIAQNLIVIPLQVIGITMVNKTFRKLDLSY